MARHRDDEDDGDPIEVDVHNLDSEWQAQPRRFHRAALKLADARYDEDKAKAKLELVEAELAHAVRLTPGRYGVTGRGGVPSNEVVKAAVLVQQEYRLALQAYLERQHDVATLKALVDALLQKKSALENSVILWCRDYGAECRVPKEHDAAARDKLDRVAQQGRWKGTTRGIDE